jgi:hypothetical protein
VGPDSFSDVNQEPVQTRDVVRLVVPSCGQLASTGDLGEPYRLIDAGGAVVEPVAAFLRELLAAGRSPATLRSYGMDLLRWWRFLGAVDVGWHRATRIEARDFSCWIQLAVKHRRRPLPDRVVATVESVGPPNPVTGKPALGPGYAPATIAHSETVMWNLICQVRPLFTLVDRNDRQQAGGRWGADLAWGCAIGRRDVDQSFQ